MKPLLLIFVVLLSVNSAHAGTKGDPQLKQKAVLVTGASSGIGLKTAEYLVKHGFYVYAGARKEKDLTRLDAMANMTSVKLDVTKQAEIDAAVKFIEKQGRGLYGIVNNAGVGTFSRMSEMPDDDILWIHDVNVMGPHRVNKAFLPLLKNSKGRTIIIGSISGYLTGATSGAYSMSKFAVEAYTESLAADLSKDGVYAGIVEPGGYRSKIREKVAMHTMTGEYKLGQKLTEEQAKQLAEAKKNNEQLKEPDEVAEAVITAMTSEKPKLRYMVAPTKGQADITVRTAMSRAIQLNADQPYELNKAQLITLLEELLEAQKQ